MSDKKYSSFRLFGRNIQAAKVHNHDYDHDDDNLCDYDESINSNNNNSKQDENRSNFEKTSRDDEPRNRTHSTVTEDGKTVSIAKDASEGTSSTKSTNQKDQKSLKKPDKILPCARCNSVATKFCYFNNYNVNQPRHFCKDCQRYWTAGGTTRNVPVGAGRRKNRNSSLMFYENVNFQAPFTWNPMAWQSGFPTPFYPSPNCSSSRKNSRDDGTLLFLGNSDSGDGRVVRAKTMKFDDPMEVANSSIGNTVTLKNNGLSGTNPITKTVARSFGIPQQQYNGNGIHDSRNNPAAYSRSLLFQ